MDATTRRLLEGPIAPTLLALAAPNVVMLVVQVAINVLEAYFVGWLGADALAGVSVTFPLIMLMQTMSAGGMGGGVASAVTRSLGAGRRKDASALIAHAMLIALAMAGLFTVIMLAGERAIYRAMGAHDGALDAALAYSNTIFAGAAAFWLFNTLASVIRGTGNMLLPAGVVLGGGALLATLSPALIFGWGPYPGSASGVRPSRSSSITASAPSCASATSSPAGAWSGARCRRSAFVARSSERS